MSGAVETIHASCVEIGGSGVLIAGPSGAGKSDLALRLIDRGATLVADDYTELRGEEDRLVAFAPATIAGLIEVRGIGIVTLPCRSGVPVALVVALDQAVERMPERLGERRIAGITLPVVALAPFEASAPIKVELALGRVKRDGAP